MSSTYWNDRDETNRCQAINKMGRNQGKRCSYNISKDGYCNRHQYLAGKIVPAPVPVLVPSPQPSPQTQIVLSGQVGVPVTGIPPLVRLEVMINSQDLLNLFNQLQLRSCQC